MKFTNVQVINSQLINILDIRRSTHTFKLQSIEAKTIKQFYLNLYANTSPLHPHLTIPSIMLKKFS